MPNLASTDLLILLLSLFCVAAIGLSMRSSVKSAGDFLQAGRALPTWLCVLAFLSASLGSDATLAAGAAGARYGLRTSLCFALGIIPALLFAACFMMPHYYNSRTVCEYLGRRFDTRTRVLSASLFVIMALTSGGISLALLGRLLQAMRVFEPVFFAYGLPRDAIFSSCVLLLAIVVLLYVLFAGLAGTMVNQALQFALLVAGFLPLVWKGLENIGGLSGFESSVAAAVTQGFVHAGGASTAAIALALGIVFGALRWTTDFRVLQTAMAAKSLTSARRIPAIAAIVWLFIAALLILPGAIAIGLPTPQSKTVVRTENGAIYHEITIVPRAIAQGHGLVPARLDPASQNAQRDAAGRPLLDSFMATPTMITQLLPTGLLGLGIAALFAGLLSSVAASIMAVNAVFTCDIYQAAIKKSADDKHLLAIARWTTVGGVLITVGLCYAFSGPAGNQNNTAFVISLLAAVALVFSVLQAPQLATYLLGMFTRRISANGAFAGLAAGTVAALLHYALTLPAGIQSGWHGGWITAAYRYPNFIAQCFATALVALLANIIVASLTSAVVSPD